MKKVVIIGGGAGGLELAVGLTKKKQTYEVILVDQENTHIWKPHLHEVAAGTLDTHSEKVDYLNLAARFGFQFVWGKMINLDKANKTISLDKKINEYQELILPERTINYDILIIATGSTSNHFGISGVSEYAYCLDDLHSAVKFYQRLIEKILQKEYVSDENNPLKLAIVGGGATGVELAAELYETTRRLSQFGLAKLHQHPLDISVINAAPHLLPGLSEKISQGATQILEDYNIAIYNATTVSEINASTINMKHNDVQLTLPYDLLVWAAGVQAHPFLSDLGLETNRNHQIVVNQQLQTSEKDIFAIGDCASVDWLKAPKEGMKVPPRAQAAHQMSDYLIKHLTRIQDGRPVPGFKYKDFGSLVSLGSDESVGTLMGFIKGKHLFIEGKIAKLMYLNLYHHHQVKINGFIPAIGLLIGKLIQKRFKPRVKLH